MSASSSRSEALNAVLEFTRRVRELGATSVRVGDVTIAFDASPVAAVPVDATESDEQRRERLLYGSSD